MEEKKTDLEDDNEEEEEVDDLLPQERDKYTNALKLYFQLKTEYEKSILAGKKKKSQTPEEFTPKCINCAKEGGTIFKKSKEHYHCYCNATPPQEKCRLNIKLYNGESDDIFKYIHFAKEFTENSRQGIIRKKLDYLFQYVDKNYIVHTLQEDLNEYNMISDDYLHYLEEFKTMFMNAENKKREQQVIAQIQSIFIQLNAKKEAVHSSTTENDKYRLIREIVEMQKNDLYPLLIKLRKLKYDEMYVIKEREEEPPRNKLVQMEYGFGKYIDEFEEPKVLYFER